jgi:acetyltransferase-like isoleucine patch superfamily enzyme
MTIHPTAFIHSHALIDDSVSIGARSRVWGFTHLLSGSQVGDDCNICEQVFIEADVVIGNRVTVKCGVQLWDGLRVEDDVFIGPNVTFANDLFPRSKRYPASFLHTIVKKGASIGGGAVILPGLTIGEGAMVGAGSVVTKSVPAHSVVVGNPARLLRYLDPSSNDNPSISMDSKGSASERQDLDAT